MFLKIETNTDIAVIFPNCHPPVIGYKTREIVLNISKFIHAYYSTECINTKQNKNEVFWPVVTLNEALQQSPWEDESYAFLQKSPTVCSSSPVFSDFQKWRFVIEFARFKQEAYTGK